MHRNKQVRRKAMAAQAVPSSSWSGWLFNSRISWQQFDKD
jgi:hypothetical protein